MFAQCAIGASMIAFGGLNWVLDGTSAPGRAPCCGSSPRWRRPARCSPGDRDATRVPSREIRFRNVTFAYPGGTPVLENFDLTIPAGSSIAIVGQNGAGKTTLAKLLCRFYDPQSGAIEIDGIDVRHFEVSSWRSRVTAVFQDFTRFELPLRDNVAPAGAPDDEIRAALEAAGAAGLAKLDTVLARGYDDGTDLSGGQWQRVALARALCAVQRRRRCRAARRADGAARCQRRGRDLRSHARGDAALHHDSHLAPVLHRPSRRPHLRASSTAA